MFVYVLVVNDLKFTRRMCTEALFYQLKKEMYGKLAVNKE